MKVALFDRNNHMTLLEKEMPKLEDHEVLIQVIKAGICGSDVHAYMGNHPFRFPPSILGHEIIGRVKEIGDNVTSRKIGDIVTIEPQSSCGYCQPCREGHYNLCKDKVVLGTPKWDGGFAEYMVAPERTVYTIPDTVSPELAVLTEPLAVGVHAVNVADVRNGDKVAILGSGPIGLMTAIAAHDKGATTICLTDAIDVNLEVAKTLCATDVVNITKQSLKQYASDYIGEFDHVFLSAGHESVIKEAFSVIKRKGKVISIALFEEKIAIDLNALMITETQMLGSAMYVKEDFETAINLIASKRYQMESLITHRFDFNEISRAMEVALTKEGYPIKIIVDF
ncbi:alcohol dehydrogenase catalytic domain-containing protein [Alkalihalobacillus sp. MEB130]|uniref:zinc-dependent alcohol dehydrogenase n=1 Tax=Alkalihalobacillus sp. MEB130 TaxID=2976704 RepID=UPI0028DF1184|nr:alcohol dehydrogenase catalytic domain-containing protein [Alkalihalobacillus sp. MEB130]MDT8862098.1 alcohol dehydrogenase catalytic domain-containing protein [Alkalihalobacillus sp. MEB130]